MNPKLLLLPGLCLGGAALVLAPARPAAGFQKLGGSLGEGQRDFRVFDNFADASANDNATPDAQFPGWLGAELAIWKGAVEWSSSYGDGTGDPLDGNLLGSGGANFDPFFAGSATSAGNVNNNIVSAVASCQASGILAFTETPISNGWQIVYCDNVEWDDGPGAVPGRYDIQGVMAHEYGHALGLSHSSVSGSTMWPTATVGQTSMRSIDSDDVAGVQCIYGTTSITKPVILTTIADAQAGTLTIYGNDFAASDIEVWFTSASATAAGADPVVRVTGLTSDGNEIVVAIPAAAGPGNVLVNNPGDGHATLSNAFPTDLEGQFGPTPSPTPVLASVSPTTIDALIPGTDEVLILTGTQMDTTTEVFIQGTPAAPGTWTIVDPNTLTLDPPQAPELGLLQITVGNGLLDSSRPLTVQSTVTPVLQWGNGDPANAVSRAAGLDMILAGDPGQVHVARGVLAGGPHTALATKTTYAPFAPVLGSGVYVIPDCGWIAVHLDALAWPLVGTTWQARSYRIDAGLPYPASNLQTITIVP